MTICPKCGKEAMALLTSIDCSCSKKINGPKSYNLIINENVIKDMEELVKVSGVNEKLITNEPKIDLNAKLHYGDFIIIKGTKLFAFQIDSGIYTFFIDGDFNRYTNKIFTHPTKREVETYFRVELPPIENNDNLVKWGKAFSWGTK